MQTVCLMENLTLFLVGIFVDVSRRQFLFVGLYHMNNTCEIFACIVQTSMNMVWE